MPITTPDRAAVMRRIGVCAHLGDADYGPHDPDQLVEMVRYIGAGTVRSNHSPTNARAREQARGLLDNGIKLHAPLPSTDDWRTPGALTRAARGYLERAEAAGIRPTSVEFPNEFNHAGDGWATAVRREVPTIAAVCRDAGVTFMGPSLLAFRTAQDAPLIATDLDGQPLDTHYDDYAMHSYRGSAAPETAHDERIRILRQTIATGDTRIVMTETGWYTGTDKPDPTPEPLQGVLAPRLLLAKLGRGVDRIFFYELLDEPHDRRGPAEQTFGLFRQDRTPKPSAQALHGLVDVLGDANPNAETFTVRPLDLTVTGPTGLQWRLFQKGSGFYFLALWQAREAARLDDPAEEVRVVTGRPMTGRWITNLTAPVRARQTDVQSAWTVPVTGEVAVLRMAAA